MLEILELWSLSLLAVIDLETTEIEIYLFDHLNSTIACRLLLDRSIGFHLNQILRILLLHLCFCGYHLLSCELLPIWWWRHQRTNECLILLIGFCSVLLLPIGFLLDEVKEVLFRDIFEISAIRTLARLHEPLEDLFEGVLLALLVSYIVAEGRLLVK